VSFPFEGKKAMQNGNIPELPIIDSTYTPSEAAKWVGVTPRRVRQYAKELNIGTQNSKKRWTYSLSDLNMMDELHKSYHKRKGNVLRNVTPRDPQAVGKLMEAEDYILRYVEGQLGVLYKRVFSLVQDVGKGYWHTTVKSLDRHERLIYNLEESLRELRNLVEKKAKEGNEGRGRLTLAGTGSLSPVHHADPMAA
jgi:hypothetical protein